MTSKTREPSAKLAHIEACLTAEVEYKKTTGLEKYNFINQAALSISLKEIDTSTSMLGKQLKAPLMIAPMTGGIERGLELNQRWARAAEHWQIAMSVGSQRIGLEDPSKAAFYQIRKHAPTALIFGNIGVAQICLGFGIEEAKRAVEMIEADALFVHFNAIQEASQDGDVDFSDLDRKLAEICSALKKAGIPVFAREVCFGISSEAAQRLINAGIDGIDCAGAGGTSWAKVEALCAKSERRQKMGHCFGEWGIPTATSILNVRSVSADIPLIATGGLRTGIDLAKVLALGADLGAMARPMLLAAYDSEQALSEFIEDVIAQLEVCMFGAGVVCVKELKPALFQGQSSAGSHS